MEKFMYISRLQIIVNKRKTWIFFWRESHKLITMVQYYGNLCIYIPHARQWLLAMYFGHATQTPVKHAYSVVFHTFHKIYKTAYYTLFHIFLHNFSLFFHYTCLESSWVRWLFGLMSFAIFTLSWFQSFCNYQFDGKCKWFFF